MNRLPLFAAAMVAASLGAQGVVSPAGYDVREGDTSNSFPFGSTTHHYMQVHGDLRGTPRTIASLSFRRDGQSETTVGVARTFTLELFLGDANLATVSSTFANNWVGTPTRVIAPRTINAPDWTQRPRVRPAPFDLVLMLDTPFNFTGTNDLGWEALLTNNSSSASYLADAHNDTGTGSQPGNHVMNGNGCTTANGEMLLYSGFTTSPTTMTLRFELRDAPPSAPSAVLVGGSDPNAAVPGLCGDGRLRTDAAFVVFNGTATSAGSYSPSASVPYNAAYVGFTFYAQGAAPDATQQGLAVAASNGLVAPVPDRPLATNGARIYLSGSTGPVGTLNNNYLLATRFQ
jgi:hypothetical protein